MMSRFVKHVTDANHAPSLHCEVGRQARGAAAEQARHGIEFRSIPCQIPSRCVEVGPSHCGIKSEQRSVLAVPEWMEGRFVTRIGDGDAHHRSDCASACGPK